MMKLLLIFVCVVLVHSTPTDIDQWRTFKQIHGKTYVSEAEENHRFNIFQNNLRTIKKHNAQYEAGEKSYSQGVTRFADLTPEEFLSRYQRRRLSAPATEDTYVEFEENTSVPEKIDWRQLGAVLEVQDEKDCPSSWAFSSIGAIEGQNAIVNNQHILLSKQQVLDCTQLFGAYGCLEPGEIEISFEYFRNYAIQPESTYPFYGFDNLAAACLYQRNKTLFLITGYRRVQESEVELQKAVGTIGPVAVTIRGSFIQHYRGGIYDDASCGSGESDVNLLVVGYGKEGDTEYWLIKNSLGVSWGEQGYLRLKRNADNLCGIASHALYPRLTYDE